MLRKHFTALVAGTALIAASMTAVPASAGSRDDKLLGLALGIGALAIIANETRANRTVAAPVRRDHNYQNYQNYRNDDHDRRYDPRWQRARVYEVPKTCLYKHWTSHGWETYASKSCVNKYAARNHIRRSDIQPRYRDERGRIVWLNQRNWLR